MTFQIRRQEAVKVAHLYLYPISKRGSRPRSHTRFGYSNQVITPQMIKYLPRIDYKNWLLSAFLITGDFNAQSRPLGQATTKPYRLAPRADANSSMI